MNIGDKVTPKFRGHQGWGTVGRVVGRRTGSKLVKIKFSFGHLTYHSENLKLVEEAPKKTPLITYWK